MSNPLPPILRLIQLQIVQDLTELDYCTASRAHLVCFHIETRKANPGISRTILLLHPSPGLRCRKLAKEINFFKWSVCRMIALNWLSSALKEHRNWPNGKWALLSWEITSEFHFCMRSLQNVNLSKAITISLTFAFLEFIWLTVHGESFACVTRQLNYEHEIVKGTEEWSRR